MVNCFRPKRSKTLSPTTTSSPFPPPPETLNHELLLRLPGCQLYLMDGGEAVQLSKGDFTLLRISDQNTPLATIVRVGEDLQWPLTKDEPVVKIDALHYLFSLPMKDGDPLSYGVSFDHDHETGGGGLGLLDAFLSENACFSCSSESSDVKKEKKKGSSVNWKEFAPRVEDYNSVLGKAIAGGTGQIVKGIFKCSNAYTNQVHKGGETILIRAALEDKHTTQRKSNGAVNKTKLNKSIKRVRKLSKMTEKMSKAMLNGVGLATGSVMGPVIRSKPGKSFVAMVPGEVLLASLDAVNKVLDAAEAAEKHAFAASSGAASRMVTKRFGESAGEATEDVLATAGHCFGIAWNVFKIRKAINPASSLSSGALNNAAKIRK